MWRNLRRSAPLLGLCLGLQGTQFLGAQPYQVGQVVTNFSLVNRFRWTNDNGQVFPSNATLRLSDFAGKIVMFEFFAVW